MWPFSKPKPRDFENVYQTALRHIYTQTTSRRPSWLSDPQKEKEFFDGVTSHFPMGSTPLNFAVRGFMAPQSAEVMFSFAASTESQGASFSEQQTATVRFINQMWSEMMTHDKEDFLRLTEGQR